MAYSAPEIKQIVTAERHFWELAYCCTSANSAQHQGQQLPAIAQHYADHARWAVDEWRRTFTPSRVGLPIAGEWTE